MVDITKKLWTLVRHGRDQGMKMDVIEEAAREIERLRSLVWSQTPAVDEAAPVDPAAWKKLPTAP